jgi:hypothetical protein
VKVILLGGLARRAQSFYELLGNRRKFERAPVSGKIFVTWKLRGGHHAVGLVCGHLATRHCD